MEEKNDFPQLGDIEHELLDHIKQDAQAKMQKKKYDIGVVAGMAVIFLATAAFVYLMFIMPDTPSIIYIVECVASILIMVAAILVVTARARRLQQAYFAEMSFAAEDYANALVSKIKSKK